jgi:hypothetical protein
VKTLARTTAIRTLRAGYDDMITSTLLAAAGWTRRRDSD